MEPEATLLSIESGLLVITPVDAPGKERVLRDILTDGPLHEHPSPGVSMLGQVVVIAVPGQVVELGVRDDGTQMVVTGLLDPFEERDGEVDFDDTEIVTYPVGTATLVLGDASVLLSGEIDDDESVRVVRFASEMMVQLSVNTTHTVPTEMWLESLTA